MSCEKPTKEANTKFVWCYCCDSAQATLKDYRERDGVMSSYPACRDCVTLPDRAFFAKMHRKNKKQEVKP